MSRIYLYDKANITFTKPNYLLHTEQIDSVCRKKIVINMEILTPSLENPLQNFEKKEVETLCYLEVEASDLHIISHIIIF